MNQWTSLNVFSHSRPTLGWLATPSRHMTRRWLVGADHAHFNWQIGNPKDGSHTTAYMICYDTPCRLIHVNNRLNWIRKLISKHLSLTVLKNSFLGGPRLTLIVPNLLIRDELYEIDYSLVQKFWKSESGYNFVLWKNCLISSFSHFYTTVCMVDVDCLPLAWAYGQCSP